MDFVRAYFVSFYIIDECSILSSRDIEEPFQSFFSKASFPIPVTYGHLKECSQ